MIKQNKSLCEYYLNNISLIKALIFKLAINMKFYRLEKMLSPHIRHTTASRKFLQEFLQDIPPLIIGPVFDKTVPNNVTGLVGRTAYLHCRVKNLGNRTVNILNLIKVHHTNDRNNSKMCIQIINAFVVIVNHRILKPKSVTVNIMECIWDFELNMVNSAMDKNKKKTFNESHNPVMPQLQRVEKNRVIRVSRVSTPMRSEHWRPAPFMYHLGLTNPLILNFFCPS
ncbi:hypothetical protein AGLY_003100 [Aphis glycines]|uniref:Uncharacterized protein n=1 Tax=Aphis glycines TaxID=307491 RepID=A0A6G0U3I6_APHGL|nr:hypothetical protein AGLY_003100 [Aphis glycines]